MSRLPTSLAAVVLLAGCAAPPQFPDAGVPVLPPCGSLPNCVNSDSGEGGQAIEPLRATRAQWQGLQRWIGAHEDWHVMAERENFIQFVAITPLLRFRDDVQLLFRPELQMIHVRSSSRLGISDMGANRKRVEMLRQQLLTIR